MPKRKKKKRNNQNSILKRVLKHRRKRKSWEINKNKEHNKEKENKRRRIRWGSTFNRNTQIVEPKKIKVPEIFSLINNAELTLEFFAKVKKELEKKNEVIFDFSDIVSVTPDAIALLLAKISNPLFVNNTAISAFKPSNKDLDSIFRESGFYHLIGNDKTKPQQGAVFTKKNTSVDPDTAVEARIRTANLTFNCDKKLQPLYRTLIECMANTKKHARGESFRDEMWFFILFNDPITKITSFSFIDTGVGIFNSTKIKKLTKFAINLGIKSNINILRDLLDGKIKSSTGLKHRGKGIPKIYSDFKNKHINNLHIIANDVYAKLEDGTYFELKHKLNGTFYYWEILPN